MSLRLELYTRQDCHLCEEMKEVVRQVSEKVPFEIEEIDIDSSEDLKERFGSEIPVLFINGRKAFKYRATIKELQKRLSNRIRK
jgi:glutaredoxin